MGMLRPAKPRDPQPPTLRHSVPDPDPDEPQTPDTPRHTQTHNPEPRPRPRASPSKTSLTQTHKRYCPNCPECTACHVHKPRDNYADDGKRSLAGRCLECEYPKCDHCGFQHSRCNKAVQERHKIDGRWFCDQKACKEARVAAAKDASHMKGSKRTS